MIPSSPTPGRDALRAAVEPLARAIAARGITADQLTLVGFGIMVVAGLLAAIQWWALAAIVGTTGAAFDLFDGAVARATGTTSRYGAFLDSTFDRWGEAVLYVGIVAGCAAVGFDIGAWLAAAAMTSAFLVSYARARAESLGFAEGRGMAAVGLAPREVRVVILGIGLLGAYLFGGVYTPPTLGTWVLGLALVAITVLGTITVIQRIVFVGIQAEQAEHTDRT
jgi:phosphatidylglycerophosphate synthase